MTSTSILSHPHAGRVITALSLPGLIRLVTEIDDNGPISHRRGSLQSAFGDLTRNQLRYAVVTGRALGLVSADEDTPDRYRLTKSGEDLAEVYDTVARWARSHQFPSATSDFVTRIQHTLKLLAHVPAAGAGRVGEAVRGVATGPVPDANAAFAPDGPQAALAEWLRAHPQVLRQAASRHSQAADEMERAA
ncbi:hypothetical protein T261_0803 [Streptomyces lydicus]|nr:hypothetical protein T261_0803 [Streptomyces lydicus]